MGSGGGRGRRGAEPEPASEEKWRRGSRRCGCGWRREWERRSRR